MIYRYRCSSCQLEREVFRHHTKRNACPKCECGARTARVVTPFLITGSFANQTMLEKEQADWELATGEKHKTAAELEAWAVSKGKAIVGKGWTPKKPTLDELVPDREIEKALAEHMKDGSRPDTFREEPS